MFTGHDHTIFLVPDPEGFDTVCTAFEAAGFLITDREDEGRETAVARQRLICFPDGSYIEILTVADPGARVQHRLVRHMAGRAGWADFAIVTDRLEEAIAVHLAADLPVTGPVRHERRLVDGRPWGVMLGLPGVGTGDPALPFLLQDTAGRDLRIPAGRVLHPNGVTGIAGVVLSTPDLAAAMAHYRPLFGAGTAREAGRRYDFAPRGLDRPATGPRRRRDRGPGPSRPGGNAGGAA